MSGRTNELPNGLAKIGIFVRVDVSLLNGVVVERVLYT